MYNLVDLGDQIPEKIILRLLVELERSEGRSELAAVTLYTSTMFQHAERCVMLYAISHILVYYNYLVNIYL